MVLHLFRPRTPIGRGTALRARSVGVQVAPRTPIHGLRRCWCGGPPVERMSGDQNPGRSPSGCSSVSRAPASGAGGRRSKACHPVQFAVTPLAQLAERSAYTRRELRTGARLEVRILQGVPNQRRVAQRRKSAALRQPRSRVRITARRRKAPLNGRRLVPKTRVTARSEVRFLSLPPVPGTRRQVSGIKGSELRLDPRYLIPDP